MESTWKFENFEIWRWSIYGIVEQEIEPEPEMKRKHLLFV
jgi:hypothetical protein